MELGLSGLSTSDDYSPGRSLPLGRVNGASPLPSDGEFALRHRSRNNRLLLAALRQIRAAVDGAIERFGPSRIGIVIGTSTSGIAEGEIALRRFATAGALPEQFHYGQQELGSPAAILA